MEPFVALTTTLSPQAGRYHQPRVEIYSNYLRLLARVGLTPVLVTPAHDREAIADLVGIASGLILTGGEDIAPARYGEEPLPELDVVNPARDAAEWTALDAALEESIPIMGICRGMQLLNVYFGGTLYQDLPTQRGDQVTHYQEEPWGQHHHTVDCTPESRLHEILGECSPLEINSFHHQAVKDLGEGLRCTARAEDGLVEGIEHTGRDWVLGVQWHPERLEAEAGSTDPNIRLMNAFADAVRAARATR